MGHEWREQQGTMSMSPYKAMFNRVHPAGVPFVLGGFVAAVLSFWLISDMLGWLLLGLTAFVVYFFRDPERVTPDTDAVLVSAADGLVSRIDRSAPPPALEMGEGARWRISVFLSVIDVHVNRSPGAGTVLRRVYVPGRFINATLDKSSEENERLLLRIGRDDGSDFAVVQIAGLIARRIVCDLRVGDATEKGARFGLIRFGSRVDVYCPEGFEPCVAEGQTVTAGETPLAAAPEVARSLTGRTR